MYYSSHLTVAKKLISSYKADLPFHQYLKGYFNQNKKHGSNDRKLISALCYNYFRLGFSFKDVPLEERLLTGFFLCEHLPSELLQSLKPVWNNVITRPLEEKLTIENWQFEVDNIFPFKDELSEQIDVEKFAFSFLHQPKLFIRIRPGYDEIILEKLNINNISFEKISGSCVALSNSAKINTVINLDREAVVQDYNSQRVGEFINMAIKNQKSEIKIWDCCAASGGKSIMAYDIDNLINLTVSDKRKSILKNLQQRFAKAGIKNYSSFIADLAAENRQQSTEKYDLIIADVPCTGSGTWARTPEQLCYFDQKQIKKYSNLQKEIVQNVTGNLTQGGHLLYVTCSVFKEENEEVLNFIKEKLELNLIKTEYYKGYKMLADTMFAALFML